jgi:hypothetical protein
MSDYTRIYNLTIKDSLPTGNSNKVIKGTELDVELNAVAAAIASKADSNDPVFTGTPLAPTATYGTNNTQLATTAFVQAALQAMYPVGSVYINATVATNPATLLGFGTWVTVGDGKVLTNQDTADTDFDVLGDTGGSKSSVSSHTHTYSGNTGGHSSDHAHYFSTSANGAHSHDIRYDSGSGTARTGLGGGSNGAYVTWEGGVVGGVGNHTHDGWTGGTNSNHSHAFSGTTASTGSSNGNLVPFVVVRMWKRVS